jgi:hypothetical protein
LTLRLASIDTPRTLAISIDNVPGGVLHVATSPASYTAGPWTLAPGAHLFAFQASGEPFRPSDRGSADNRPLTIMFTSNERWNSSR